MYGRAGLLRLLEARLGALFARAADFFAPLGALAGWQLENFAVLTAAQDALGVLLLPRGCGTGQRSLLTLTLLRALLLLLDLRRLSHGLAGGLGLPVALRALDLVHLDGALDGRNFATRRNGTSWCAMLRDGTLQCALRCDGTLRCAMRRGACGRLSAAPASAFGSCCF